jgi:hypothetical protein
MYPEERKIHCCFLSHGVLRCSVLKNSNKYVADCECLRSFMETFKIRISALYHEVRKVQSMMCCLFVELDTGRLMVALACEGKTRYCTI